MVRSFASTAHGRPQFRDLLFRRGEPRFYAFDALWIEGDDLRYLPLIERKARLRFVVPSAASGSCTATTLKRMARGCSGWRAKPTLKASSASTSTRRTCPSERRRGSRLGTVHTLSGSEERNCSSGSGSVIPMFMAGIVVRKHARRYRPSDVARMLLSMTYNSIHPVA